MKKILLLLPLLLIINSCGDKREEAPGIKGETAAGYSPENTVKSAPLDKPLEQEAASFEVFYLQLGAFKTPYFADQLIKKSKQMGYTTKSYKISKPMGTFTVVEIGPFNKKSQALKHRNILIKRLGLTDKPLLKIRIQ